MTYHGGDARQGDYCLEHFEITFAHDRSRLLHARKSDAARRHDIAYVARYADAIYALNPDLFRTSCRHRRNIWRL